MVKQDGITIVALVITIIIMLILAGVVINGISQDNGIVKNANESVILSSLKEVDEALKTYSTAEAGKKIRQGDYSGQISMEELAEKGILKKVEIEDTLRTIGIVQDLKELGVKGNLGKGAKKVEKEKYSTITEINDVYAVDLEDNTLYYIKDDIWSISGTKEIGKINIAALEKRKFITTWEVAEGENIVLPIPKDYTSGYECKIEVVYEDEEKNQILEQEITLNNSSSITSEDFKNLRTIVPKNNGKYIIKIMGECKKFDFNIADSKDMIKEINQFGEVNLEILDLSQCSNLTKIAEPTEKSFMKTTKMIFYKTAINNIPINFLRNATNLKNISFEYTNLESIPKGLFDNNSKITSFERCFKSTNIMEIPEGLFNNNIGITSFKETFAECSQISKIPENLFKNNSEVTDFTGTFRNTNIKEIPVDLFRYNTKVLYFSNGNMGWGGCFNGCANIKEIPKDIFKYNIKATNFSGVFLGTGITEVSSELFLNNTEALDFSCIFQSTPIKEVPEDLFKYNKKVTSFYRTFHASSLQHIPAKLFINNKNVKNFSTTFGACNKLTGTVPELWNKTDSTKENYFPNVTAYDGCFSNTPSAIRKQVPTAWGGTNTEIVIE